MLSDCVQRAWAITFLIHFSPSPLSPPCMALLTHCSLMLYFYISCKWQKICVGLVLIKVQAFRPETLLKRDYNTGFLTFLGDIAM